MAISWPLTDNIKVNKTMPILNNNRLHVSEIQFKSVDSKKNAADDKCTNNKHMFFVSIKQDHNNNSNKIQINRNRNRHPVSNRNNNPIQIHKINRVRRNRIHRTPYPIRFSNKINSNTDFCNW